MKNFTTLFVLYILMIVQNGAFSQTTISMGGGVINSVITSKTNLFWEGEEQQILKPFVGFTYEYYLNQNFYLSTNTTYSRQKFDYYFVESNLPTIEFFDAPNARFVQISGGALINFKVFSTLTNSKFWNGFNIGLGLNVDHLRDFRSDSFFGNSDNFSHKDNRNQFGFIYHLSWNYKKFRLTYNVANGIKMFGNHENLVTATDWRTLSASYIYTFTDYQKT